MKRILALALTLVLMQTLAFAEEEMPISVDESLPQADEAVEMFEPIQNGTRGDREVALQNKLIELSYLNDNADGIFGPKSEAALKELQADMGWENTGKVTSQKQLDTIDSIGIINTGMDSLAVADGALARPVENIYVKISPVQEGTGDPSPENVRPFRGVDSVKLYRMNKNLLMNFGPETLETNGVTFTRSPDGSVTANGTATNRATYLMMNRAQVIQYLMPLNGKEMFVGSGCPEGGGAPERYWINFQGFVGRGDGIGIPDTGNRSEAFTIEVNTDHETMQTYICIGAGQTVSDLTFYPMMALASEEDQPYSPCPDATFEIAFPAAVGAIYGGTLNVTTGELVAYPFYEMYNGELLVGPWLSSIDVYEEGKQPTIGAQVVDMGGNYAFYQISPVTVDLLSGLNVMWVDSGELSASYYGWTMK